MERSDFLIKLISVILFVAILLYIGLSAVSSLTSSLQTVTAVSSEYENVCTASGWAVRNETVISGTGGSIYIIAENGKRISKGGELALEFTDSDSIRYASELNSLKLRKSQLEATLSGEIGAEEAFESIITLSRIVRGGDYTSLDEAVLAVDSTVRTHSGASDESELQSVMQRINELEAFCSEGTKSLFSPISGIFTSVVDGLEGITPNSIAGKSPSELQELFSETESVPDEAIGKLVTDITWYYAAIIDEKDAAELVKLVSDSEGNIDTSIPVNVKFTKMYKASTEMCVQSVSAPENGKCSVIFSSTQGLEDAVSQRNLTAEIIFESVSGLKIPTEALHEEDGKNIVYIVTGLQAEAVEVEIIGRYDDYIFVKDGSETGTNLRSGTRVITKANDLSDGKVVLK